jgi:hypothetical protein
MSNRNSPKLKEFAQRLLAQEAASNESGGGTGAAFCICERFRISLANLMGSAGYRALLARAVALAGAEVPWLRGLHIRADSRLEDMAELVSKLTAQEIARGEVALVTELLGLLVTFIGPALTVQLMQEAWPEADLGEVEF